MEERRPPGSTTTQERAPRLGAFLAATAGAALLLGLAWRAFYAWQSPTFILTPFEGQAPLAPLYAFFRPAMSLDAWIALVVLGGGLFASRRVPVGRRGVFLAVAVLYAVSFRFAVHAVRDGSLPGREFLTYAGEDVIFDVPRIGSIGGFLRDYTALQPSLSLHGRTKPPGFALLLYGIIGVVGPRVSLIGSLLTLLAGLIVVPAFYFGGGLRGREEDGRACALLAATAPCSVLFGAVSIDAVFAVVAAVAMVVAVRELRRPHWITRATLGVLLFAGMMLSYSTFIVGLFAGVLLLVDRLHRPLRCIGHLLGVLVAFLLPFLALARWVGFDAWICFRNAQQLNEASMTEIVGHSLSGGDVWMYCSLGNLLAFLLTLGLPIAGSWLLLVRHRFDRVDGLIGVAFAAALLTAAFGGLYLMETERILIFLAPPAFVLAARARAFSVPTAVALCGLQAIATEVFLLTLW